MSELDRDGCGFWREFIMAYARYFGANQATLPTFKHADSIERPITPYTERLDEALKNQVSALRLARETGRSFDSIIAPEDEAILDADSLVRVSIWRAHTGGR